MHKKKKKHIVQERSEPIKDGVLQVSLKEHELIFVRIEKAIENIPLEQKDAARAHLLEETRSVVGTGVNEGVIERLIQRSLENFKKEKHVEEAVVMKEQQKKETEILPKEIPVQTVAPIVVKEPEVLLEEVVSQPALPKAKEPEVSQKETPKKEQEEVIQKVFEESSFPSPDVYRPVFFEKKSEQETLLTPSPETVSVALAQNFDILPKDVSYDNGSTTNTTLVQKTRSSRDIAIDISDYSVEVLQLDEDKSIVAYGRTLLEEGIVKSGEIVKPDILITTIKELFLKTRPQPIIIGKEKLTAILSFPESKTFVHRIALPVSLNEKMFEAEILKEVGQIVPFEQKDVLWDYRIISKDVKNTYILYVGTLRVLVETYVHVLEGAGIDPVLIDLELDSLGRVLLSDETGKPSCAIIDMGAETTSVGVFNRDKQLVFSHLVFYGGTHAAKDIMQKKNISFAEAENFKRSYGFDRSRPNNDIAPILEKSALGMLSEIKKILARVSEQTRENIEFVVLAGGSSLLPGIVPFFSEKLGIPVVLKDPLNRINRPHYMDESTSILYANVVGLALRASENISLGINLLKRGKGFSPQKRSLERFYKKILSSKIGSLFKKRSQQ